MPEWPPPRYTVLRVFGDGHRAELLGDEEDRFDESDEPAWRAHWQPALAFARAHATETDDGDSLVVAFVVWDRD